MAVQQPMVKRIVLRRNQHLLRRFEATEETQRAQCLDELVDSRDRSTVFAPSVGLPYSGRR
jgi:hypothetical protein